MSPMRLIILAVAAGAAVLAAIMFRTYMANQQVAAAPMVTPEAQQIVIEEAKVLVANADLARGQLLTPEDFRWADWPQDSVNIGFFTEEMAADAMETLSGSVVRTEMYESEPILPQKVVQKGDTGYMAALLSPGMRATSVEIAPESASGGFILPDDRVDVILTYDIEINDGDFQLERPHSVTVIENARVLAIDQRFRPGESGEYDVGEVATLELGPRESELLALSQRTGAISLSLRSLSDAYTDRGTISAKTEMLDLNTNAGGNSTIKIFRNGQPKTSGGS